MLRRAIVPTLLLGSLASGCAPRDPITAAEMAREGGAEALVRYLAQPGATAAVCDPKHDGPRFRAGSPDDYETLVGALLSGEVRPVLWRRCAALVLEGGDAASSTALLDAMAEGYRALLSSSDVDADPDERAKLDALHEAFVERPRGTSPRADAVAPHVAALREALEGGHLGPYAARRGRELSIVIDVEQGRFEGKRIDVALLDEREAAGDVATLRQIERRIPDEALAREARKRIVRRRIADSPLAEVRARADEVLERVLATGQNAVDLSAHPVQRAWLDESRAKVRRLVVRQELPRQVAKLLAQLEQGASASLVPTIDLRGGLAVEVAGYTQPLTICASPEALDVTPCVLPEHVRPSVPIVRIDARGLLHFVDRIATRDAIRLVYDTPNLPIEFDVGGKRALTVDWPIEFESTGPVIFGGPPSGRGPDLEVRVERRYAPRLVFEVKAPEGIFAGVIEERDLDGFVIASRGGEGSAGTRGYDGGAGSNGMAGSPASCPYSSGGSGTAGGRGQDGGAGGPGGPGGPGGDVVVDVSCATGECGGFAKRVAAVVRSLGGPGGPGGEGGRGGPGGKGGPGGSGASCTDSNGQYRSVSGGMAGPDGADGSPGPRGADGPTGAPGRVDLRLAR
jgi:hypothetical protein